MKLTVAFALLFIGAALAGDVIKNRPDCSTEIQLKIKTFSYTLDPSKYWVCTKVGVPAILASCPEGQVFIPNLQKCVSPSNLKPSQPIHKPDISKDDLPWDRSALNWEKPSQPISKPNLSKDDLPWDASNLNWQKPSQPIPKPEISNYWQKSYQSISKPESSKDWQKAYQSISKPEISKDDLPWKKPTSA